MDTTRMRTLACAALVAVAIGCGGGDDEEFAAVSVMVTATGNATQSLDAFAVSIHSVAASGSLIELGPVGVTTRLTIPEGPDGEYNLTTTGLASSYDVFVDGKRQFSLPAPLKPNIVATSSLGGTKLDVSFTGISARVCATQMGGVGECKSGTSPMTFMVATDGKPFLVEVFTTSSAAVGDGERTFGSVNLTTKLDVP